MTRRKKTVFRPWTITEGLMLIRQLQPVALANGSSDALWHYTEMRQVEYQGKRIDLFVQ